MDRLTLKFLKPFNKFEIHIIFHEALKHSGTPRVLTLFLTPHHLLNITYH